MKILKVPDGESPNPDSGGPGPAVVICRGDSHNLWINHQTEDTFGYPEYTEEEAMVFGLSASPGTPDNQYISTIQSEMQSRFGVDISTVGPNPDAVQGEPSAPNLVSHLQNTPTYSPSDDGFNRPWDCEQWNTAAGEDPKRTPIHEVDQQENR